MGPGDRKVELYSVGREVVHRSCFQRGFILWPDEQSIIVVGWELHTVDIVHLRKGPAGPFVGGHLASQIKLG